ncbi:NRDE family protein [Aspergillus alliaceus]|uniref:NRDE family protein n=1 Tax=Petromyces alliaceus TaxID=209559 RepID=UPI0012A6F653|nr:NRDE protein-domain-containing protein [Aspergillus alliaceus]KAB8230327.1 NRDE protein-domain-containing protein [Aspergillus alliaceus]
MCIALISTAHPSYSLIIIDNRDEYLRRPTSPADWWPEPESNILGGRDLARATHGTWMGITKEGKIAVLTNYREDTTEKATGTQSRGAIVNGWLTEAPEPRQSTRDFAQSMVASPMVRNVGGFSLVCGYVNEPLAVISNRSSNMDQVTWLATEQGQTVGLSNTHFDDRSWPKIIDGEKLMIEAIQEHVDAGEDEDGLIDRLLGLLSRNTLPELSEDATAEDYLPHFRKSIFIPVLGAKGGPAKPAEGVAAACVEEKVTTGAKQGDELDQSYLHGAYGTQKQTVILVSHVGRVRYFERTLYDDEVNAVPLGKGDRSYEFQVAQ